MTQIKATYMDHMGDDLSVVNAARVSFGKISQWPTNDWSYYDEDEGVEVWDTDKTLSERDTKLIKYLANHGHISPFGHAFVSLHVKAPIFVARQLVKHKFLRWNEISRRYVDDEPEFYVPDVWRGRAENVKQGSTGEVKVPYLVPHEFNRSARYEYETLLEAGVCPEQARMVLPQSTMTEWYWSGSLDAFAAMCKLRCASDTQYETRLVAQQIHDIIFPRFPVSWEALVGGEFSVN
jgi:thymidylate synthase (FAD)|tara:strand:- start:310 stop:1017 length:708 start_codon:yes stop_codon:yes gene_type:complete